jgi:hypothetical protein
MSAQILPSTVGTDLVSAVENSRTDVTALPLPVTLPLVQEWNQLFERTPRKSYTQNPERVLLAAEIKARTVELTDADLTGQLLTCRAGTTGVLIGAGALIPKRIAFGPLLDRLLGRSLRGYHLAAGEFLGEESPEIMSALLGGVTRELAEPRAEFVLFENVELESLLWNKLHELGRQGYLLHHPQGVQPRLRIRFPENPEDYWKQFSSKTRNTFRRKQKHLGATELRKFTRPDQVAEFLDLAHSVSLKSWQSRQLGLRIENNASEKSMYTWEAEAGVFRSYVLMRENRPLAFLVGNQYRGWFNYEEVGYDCEFSASSPGTVLLLQVFEELLKNDPPQVFDFGAGDADYKRMFANWTSSSGDIWLVSRKFSAQTAVRCLQANVKVRKWGKSLLAQAGVWRKVRQFLRQRQPKAEVQAS